jgi:hypothetical protein
LHLQSDFVQGGSNPFSLTVPFDTPFFYDPRKGKLLIDFFTYEGVGIKTDQDGGGDSWTTYGTLNTSQASFPSGSLPASFTVMPIPEPSTFYLLIALIPVLGFRYCRRHWTYVPY